MTTVAGVVVAATDILRVAFGLETSASCVLVRADDARALRFPSATRWLGRIGPVRLGAAVVDGRILPCLDASAANVVPIGARATAPRATRGGAGLVIQAADRGESVMLLGVEVIRIGKFGVAGADEVHHAGEIVPIVDTVRCFAELERLSLEIGRGSRGPTSDERRGS